jgi:YD repeat-containing protein
VEEEEDTEEDVRLAVTYSAEGRLTRISFPDGQQQQQGGYGGGYGAPGGQFGGPAKTCVSLRELSSRRVVLTVAFVCSTPAEELDT